MPSNRMKDQWIAKIQRGVVLLLFFVFPIEPSHLKWRIHALHIKLGFFVSDLILLLLFFLFFFRAKKDWVLPFRNWPSLWLFLFYLMGIFSILFSPSPFCHEQSFRLLILFTKILLFSSLAFLLEEGGKKFLHQMIFVIGAVAILEACVALFCYFTQSYLDLKHFRLLSLSEVNNPSSFALPHGFRWIGDRIFGIERTPWLLRSYGTFNHPNILGGFFVFTLLVSYFLFLHAQKRARMWGMAFGIFLQVMALCVTYSRAALFSWAGATLLFLGFFFLPKKEEMQIFRKRVYGLVGVLSFSLFLSFAFFGEQFFHRGGVIQSNALVQRSDSLRLQAQDTAFFLIQKHPFFGVGLENYLKASSPSSGKEAIPMIHNCYLLIASEMGVVALLFFFNFLLSLFLRMQRKSIGLETLLFLSSTIGLLVIALFDFYPLSLQAGMICFFVSAALFFGEGEKKEKLLLANKRPQKSIFSD
jgi:hypothetical protein